MQRLSHGTRAFLWNADGLPGFIVEFDGIMTILKKAQGEDNLENHTKYQIIDLAQVENELNEESSLRGKFLYLSLHYPCLYIFVIKYMKLHVQIENYMNHCKS